MPSATANVSLFDKLPTRNDLRAAVAKIVRAVQLEHDLTDANLASQIGVERQTVANARNEACDMNALTIAAIGKRFGESSIDPYMGLLNARAVPKSCPDTPDPLPSMAALMHKLALAKGRNHQVYLDMRAELRAALADLSALDAHVSGLA